MFFFSNRMLSFFLEPSIDTLKRRRWRANRKDKSYSVQLALTLPIVEQIVNKFF